MVRLNEANIVKFITESGLDFEAAAEAFRVPVWVIQPINGSINNLDLLSGSGNLFEAIAKIQNSLTEFVEVYEQICLRVLTIAQDQVRYPERVYNKVPN